MKKLLTTIFATMLLALTSLGSIGEAHTLWINFTDYTPSFSDRFGGKSKLYMGWGHHFPVDSYVKSTDFKNITLLSPSGKHENITLETTGFAAAELRFKEEGLYLTAVTRKDAYNTAYMENGRIKQIKGTKEGLPDVVSSTYSQQFAKALLQIGSGKTQNLGYIFGHKLEIIPLTNPYEITNNRGGIMKVKVLFNGEPVQFKKVSAAYAGYDIGDKASCTASTDRNGVAELRIDHWGVWVAKVKLENQPTIALADKVNQENYFASLTFYVP